MIQQIYTSEAQTSFSNEQIEHILNLSNENNLKHHVSGFLFYIDNYFLQILEGPEAGINAVYEKVASNNSHHILIESQCQTEKKIAYNKWPMGYDPTLNSTKGIEEYCKEYNIYHYETALQFLKRRLEPQTSKHLSQPNN